MGKSQTVPMLFTTIETHIMQTMYISSFMGFSAVVLCLFLLEETYPPMILVGKASELRRRTKNWGIHAKQEEVELDLRELLSKNVGRYVGE